MVWRYLKYILRSRHVKGRGIHSPFAFNIVNKVLFNNEELTAVREIEELRKSLKKNHQWIYVSDYGAGSKILKKKRKKISDIVRYSSVSRKNGLILFHLVRTFKPDEIIELGTSFGISTMYMALATDEAIIKTIDACATTSKFAQRNMKHLKIKGVRYIVHIFSKGLSEALSTGKLRRLVFIDGDHRYDSTIRYVKEIIYKSKRDSVIVIDDINWSHEMYRAWSEIITWSEIRLSLELFHFGLLFLKPDISKQHYVVRVL